MLDLLTAAEMRAADEATIAGGVPSQVLMERAAKAALQVLKDRFDTTHVLFLCGSGNNGGDGLAMARFLAEAGGKASVFYLGKRQTDGTPDPTAMSEECARQYALLTDTVKMQASLDTRGVTAVVDAIFGIGLCRPIEGEIKDCIQAITATGIPVLALDIPSGVHSDTGSILSIALPAKVTVAIAAAKWGHYLYPGTLFCGETQCVDIGVYTKASSFLVKKSDLSELPARPAKAHKGTFGRVLVIGGSVGMSGAGYFAAKAALRAGAGLAEIFAPTENRIIYQTQLPEALLTLYNPDHFDEQPLRAAISRADAIAIGMGLGQNELTYQMLACVLEHATVPVVLDADALNVMAISPALRELCACSTVPTILTPHLGEASRLFSRPLAAISQNLAFVAKEEAAALRSILVLKDARTVVSDGMHLYLNTYGNSGMATGGSGDVLAGIITAFAAQGATPINAASLGVLAHALAGDAALVKYGNRGMIASDIIDGLCDVLK
ncbi:MAG: NAD(P)H-hydrate dehydratase [Ruminococcaceae bacterium]|nr:NAD(P)H-hydrate dehydratase [Oscillospiraceae bacterium]